MRTASQPLDRCVLSQSANVKLRPMREVAGSPRKDAHLRHQQQHEEQQQLPPPQQELAPGVKETF